jgi:fermentation-respiration switch protein FrsA (DUF1100 family)
VKRYAILTALLAVIFFYLALRGDVYDATSPPGLEWHVLLRKLYSVVAFALVGYCFRRTLDEYGARGAGAFLVTVAGLAAYSATIEGAQAIAGSAEGIWWNAFDVACGAAGGALGAYLAAKRPTRARRPR